MARIDVLNAEDRETIAHLERTYGRFASGAQPVIKVRVDREGEFTIPATAPAGARVFSQHGEYLTTVQKLEKK